MRQARDDLSVAFASVSRPMLSRSAMRLRLRALETLLMPYAPLVLVVSVIGNLAMRRSSENWTMIDLGVYRGAPPHLFGGHLFDYKYTENTPAFALPFTYPPFAAMLFLPLSLLGWTTARGVWYVASIVALWWLVRSSLRLIAASGGGEDEARPGQAPAGGSETILSQRRALLWTAAALWIEPVCTTLNYGQINLVLAATLLAAITHSRQAVAGMGVGLAAGVKLTPAVSGLYFLVTRRFAAAAWSLAAFLLTVGLGFLAAPGQSHRFWFELLGDAGRVGPIGSAINQSLRGALSRSMGHDVGLSAPWLVASVVAAVLAGFALREAVRAADALATVVIVQVFGLLVSPISWSHHWVWVVPAMLWMSHGSARFTRIVAVTWTVWLVAVGSFVISFLLRAQPSIWVIGRPWYLSVLGWAYPACGLLTLVVIPIALRLRARTPEPAAVS